MSVTTLNAKIEAAEQQRQALVETFEELAKRLKRMDEQLREVEAAIQGIEERRQAEEE